MNLLRRALTRQPPPSNTNDLPSNITFGGHSPYNSSNDSLLHGNPPPPNSSCTSLTNPDPDLVIYHRNSPEVEEEPSHRGAKIYQVAGSIRHWMMTDAEILEDKSHREHSARMERILCPQPNHISSKPKPQPPRESRRTSRRLSRKVIPFERPISKALPSLPLFNVDGEEGFVFVAVSPDDPEFAFLPVSDEEDSFVFIPTLSPSRNSASTSYNPHSDENIDPPTFVPPSPPSPSSSRRTSRNSTRASHNPRLTFTPPSDINEEDEEEEEDIEDDSFVLIPSPPQSSLPPPRNRDSIVASYYFGAHLSLDMSSPPVIPTQHRRPHSHPHLHKIRIRWKGR